MENTIRTGGPLARIGFLSVAAAPFRALGRLIIDLGERVPVMVALSGLHDTSDQQLLAKGRTRRDEVRRILLSRTFF